MYRPKGGSRKGAQGGGAATATTTTVPTPTLSMSTLQTLINNSGVSTLGDVASLTVNQISSLVAAINQQISNDQATIALNTLAIADLNTQIDSPNGLQDQLTVAQANYDSTMSAYIFASTLLIQSEQTLQNEMSSLAGLSSLSHLAQSTMDSYNLQFQELLEKQVNVDGQLSTFNAEYKDQQNQLNTYEQNESETAQLLSYIVSSLNATNKTYSSVIFNYNSTNTEFIRNGSNNVNSLAYFAASENTSTFIVNISTISAQKIKEEIAHNNLSTMIGQYDISEVRLTEFMRSTLSNISTYSNYSTFYHVKYVDFMSSYTYYSTLEILTLSSISGLTQESADTLELIANLNLSSSQITAEINSETNSLVTYGPQFYSYLQAQMDSEVTQYQYVIQQFNAANGMTVANLSLLRMHSLNAQDVLNFKQATDTRLTAAQKAANTDTINAITNQVKQIDAMTTILNPLEIQFNSLIQQIGIEQSLKNNMMDLRKNIFNTEVQVYQGILPTATIKNDYLSKFSTVNGLIVQINSAMNTRNRMLSVIQANFSPANRSTIVGLIGGVDLFSEFLSIVDSTGAPLNNTPIPQQSTDPTQPLSSYAVISPIEF